MALAIFVSKVKSNPLGIDFFPTYPHARAWLMRTAWHELTRLSRRTRFEVALDYDLACHVNPEKVLDARDLLRQVIRALLTLRPSQRTVLLRAFVLRTMNPTVKVRAMSSARRQRLRRAYRALQRALESLGVEQQ